MIWWVILIINISAPLSCNVYLNWPAWGIQTSQYSNLNYTRIIDTWVLKEHCFYTHSLALGKVIRFQKGSNVCLKNVSGSNRSISQHFGLIDIKDTACWNQWIWEYMSRRINGSEQCRIQVHEGISSPFTLLFLTF